MSPDEIVFDDVKYREPERRRRPDRDRRWASLAYEIPGPDDLPIFLDRKTADAIERHALRDTSVELGGILLGKECVDDQTGQPFVWVTNALEARHFENTQASFTYTHDSWEEISRERDARHPDLDIVGWYHTHPDFGVFLSGHDLFIQQHFFGQPLQLAYVVDPIRQTRGFFQWRDGRMVQVGGFYLTADRGDRSALARLVNDLEQIPNSEASGGGFSPRLEAELINMLSRPSMMHAQSVRAERSQTAAVFALLGAFLGVIGLSAVLWLGQLNQQVAEQAKTLAAVEKTIVEASERQRVVFDAVAGRGADDFRERYASNARALDEARAKLSNQEAVNDALAERAGSLGRMVETLRGKLDAQTKLAERFQQDAGEVERLRPQMQNLLAENSKQAKRIGELEVLADTTEGREALSFKERYEKTWLLAMGGWAISAILAMIAVGGYIVLRSPPADPAETVLEQDEPPAHRIG